MNEVLTTLKALGEKYITLRNFEKSLKAKVNNGKNVDDILENVEKSIRAIQKHAKELVKKEPIYCEWLHYVKGVGISHALTLYGYVDFSKAKTVSSLWVYGGLVNVDNYSREFKGALIRIGMSLLGIREIRPYVYVKYEFADDRKYAKYFAMRRREADEKYPDWTKPHKFWHAMRMTLKMFTAHYFIVYKWFYENKAYIPYPIKLWLEGKLEGKHHIYLPFVDTYKHLDWLNALEYEYAKLGIPVKREP